MTDQTILQQNKTNPWDGSLQVGYNALGDVLDAGMLLALLKYPFYPLFNFDNSMNLISKSLTILTSAQLLVVFTFAHIF